MKSKILKAVPNNEEGSLHPDEDDAPLFTIGIIAKMIGVSVHTLRLYESSGLIVPHRTDSKRRIYSRNDVRRLSSIRYLIEERGLNLAGIKMLLSLIPCWDIKGCSDEDRSNCDAFSKMVEPCWVIANKSDKCLNDKCWECPVYTQFTSFQEIKGRLSCLDKEEDVSSDD
ncbi:MAG: MerR family transcriptional regulator [Bdellovibrionales bacterium]|jgi:MerR family transcriptional regulator, heat shock protein HspR|nr:MerR family transcriptional regulator [Bdellovibrionales bacterium]MBT3525199.1 MerR family transcriptional regulator [Bdellovibrionales bacterium]MBT7668668.1 MerR family transcriptional regulator [Bdellovibrionales bacterium]MBT7766544.1 MerR family transcriptional regulator [Bdellovibrionales bacterium]